MRESTDVVVGEDAASLALVDELLDDADAVVIGAAVSSGSEEQPAATRSADVPNRAATARRDERQKERMELQSQCGMWATFTFCGGDTTQVRTLSPRNRWIRNGVYTNLVANAAPPTS